jgi:putative NIF3 family GTP cyclohydrolase 1 type 2
MNVKQVFDLGLSMGTKADPRGIKGIKEYLARAKKEYEDCKPKDKKFFDKERLVNPYADSGIHVDDNKTQIKRVMAGIDIDDGEILLASQLGERNKPVDLVISHHPVGKSYADLHGVMDMQVDMFINAGVPAHVAEKIMEKRIGQVGRGVHPRNHYQLIDVAKLLKVNLINTHTITDNLVKDYLDKYLAKKKLQTVGDVYELLLEIPEYEEAAKRGAGPSLFAGDMKHRLGKFMVDMTGGTNPSDDIYKELSLYGVSTIVGMHMGDPSRKIASESHMNVVIAGHYASDSLGMNLYLDELEKKGIEVVPVGGLIRFSRVKKK